MLKNLIYVTGIFLLCMYAPLSAQDEPEKPKNPAAGGSVVLSIGDFFAFSAGTDELFKDFDYQFGFNPGIILGVHYIPVRGLALGGEIGFMYYKYSDLTAIGWAVGPSFIYYITYINDWFLPFIGVGLRFYEDNYDYDDYKDKFQYFQFNISTGFCFVLIRHLGISISYEYARIIQEFGTTYEGYLPKGRDILFGNLHTIEIGFKFFI